MKISKQPIKQKLVIYTRYQRQAEGDGLPSRVRVLACNTCHLISMNIRGTEISYSRHPRIFSIFLAEPEHQQEYNQPFLK
jgi:hypothetical protein